MSIGNRIVQSVLASPAHRLLSGSTDVVRYRGRRSGRENSTPTQYARSGDDVVILVARPESKTWWRNFREPRDLDVLLAGRWHAMTGRALLGAEEPEAIAPLLDAYLTRFPKASRYVDGEEADPAGLGTVIVWCWPR